MKDSLIFVAFFGFWTLANIVAPVPMFPGNMVYIWFETTSVSYFSYISAIINGVTYGLAVWIVYEIGSGMIGRSTSEELIGEEKKQAHALLDDLRVVVCSNPKCQREIEEPILLNNLSADLEEQYYACPHCFMKLGVESAQLQEEEEEKKEEEEPTAKPPEKGGKEPSGCPHHFGYLAKRSNDVLVPQECLICPKIGECMLEPHQDEEDYASR